MIERFRKAVASLPVRIVDEIVVYSKFSSLKDFPQDRICLQFIKEDAFFLVCHTSLSSNFAIAFHFQHPFGVL